MHIEKIMDIIIEDGSHTITDQQRSIDLYLEKLNIGGYFIIEDIEAALSELVEEDLITTKCEQIVPLLFRCPSNLVFY